MVSNNDGIQNAETDKVVNETNSAGQGGNFSQRVWDLLISEGWTDGTAIGLKDDLFAGVTLTMTQVAPAVAFAVMAKVNPMSGLYTSFFVGVICSIFGGRPGQISAAAGALAVVYPEIVNPYGPEALYAVSILTGILMIIPGIFRLGQYVRMLPASVMIGFVDGLAIVLARGQIPAFKDEDDNFVTGSRAGYTALICIITFVTMFVMPIFTKIIPSTFVALILGTAIEHIFQLGTVTVGDLYTLKGEFPSPQVPDIDWNDGHLIGEIWVHAIIVGIIGFVESMLTVHVLDVLTETKGSFNRESIAIGVANIVSGFFTGFAGCAVIGPTILNFASGGGRRRLSAFITGLMMIIVVLALYEAINWIPMGALSAVLFGIVVKTFDWRTWEMIFLLKIPISDSLVIITVTLVTVFTDLAIAVACGLAVAMCFYIWDMAKGRIVVNIEPADMIREDPEVESRVRVIHAKGSLFFASCMSFQDALMEMHEEGDDEKVSDIVIDFGHGKMTVHDFSAVDVMQEIASQYSRHSQRLHVRNMDVVSGKLFKRARKYAPDIHDDNPKKVKHIVMIKFAASKVQQASADNSPHNEPIDVQASLPEEEGEVKKGTIVEERADEILIGFFAFRPTTGICVPYFRPLSYWQQQHASQQSPAFASTTMDETNTDAAEKRRADPLFSGSDASHLLPATVLTSLSDKPFSSFRFIGEADAIAEADKKLITSVICELCAAPVEEPSSPLIERSEKVMPPAVSCAPAEETLTHHRPEDDDVRDKDHATEMGEVHSSHRVPAEGDETNGDGHTLHY